MVNDVEEDLIYDIGMHRGNDAAFYLEMGYRVVGIEANPDLAEFTRKRFAGEIAAGRMIVIEGAIAGRETGTVTFYRRAEALGSGSLEASPSIPGFDGDRMRVTDSREVLVVDLVATLEEFGTPHYMKVDIEGAENYCLDALKKARSLPEFLSLEAARTGVRDSLDQLQTLRSLGYSAFSLRPQSVIEGSRFKGTRRSGESLEFTFEDSSSGPFGEHITQDDFVSVEEIEGTIRRFARSSALKLRLRPLKRIPLLGRLARAGAQSFEETTALFEWYDLHARR